MKNSVLQKTWKSYVKLWERQTTDGEWAVTNQMSDKDLYSQYANLENKNSKQHWGKKKPVLKNGQKIWKNTLPKNIYEWQIKTWKDLQNLTSHYGNTNWNHSKRSPITMA